MGFGYLTDDTADGTAASGTAAGTHASAVDAGTVLRSAPRTSGADILVPQKPPDFGYISRRVRHDRHVPGTSEDVNIVPMDCLTWVRTGCSATPADAYATIATLRARVRM